MIDWLIRLNQVERTSFSNSATTTEHTVVATMNIKFNSSVLVINLIPLYSADAANTASLRLADAAGYRAFAHIATFE